FSVAATLSEGENYFWLLADVDPAAAPGTVIDAAVTALYVAGAEVSVLNADPEGETVTVNTYDPVLADKTQELEVGEYPVVINGIT
ncbi:hypothetical protein GUG51_16255, partial [Xanthomonas citri pv. citri]|nr:hypothetical protein [Xanthomonas citri pv. citri]